MNLPKLDSLTKKSISLPKSPSLPKLGGGPSVPLPPFLGKLVAELRQRKLLPLAMALVLALVAIPVLLSSGSVAPPAPSAAALASAARPAAAALPVLNVASGSSSRPVTGPARDPFSPQSGVSHPAAASAVAASAPSFVSPASHSSSGSFAGGSTGGAPTSSGSGSSAAGSVSAPSTSFSAPAAPVGPLPAGIVVAARPRPSFTALAADQAYRVALALTNPAGGVQTTDPLERLSPIPNAQHPLLVELGVLQGGRRVLFALLPNVLVSGPGSCIPGPRDCEILSLAAGQVEELGVRWGSRAVPLYMFSVTGLAPQAFPSSAAASSVRQAQSSAGAAILRADKLPALSLFRYRTRIGALADLRNLAFGG